MEESLLLFFLVFWFVVWWYVERYTLGGGSCFLFLSSKFFETPVAWSVQVPAGVDLWVALGNTSVAIDCLAVDSNTSAFVSLPAEHGKKAKQIEVYVDGKPGNCNGYGGGHWSTDGGRKCPGLRQFCRYAREYVWFLLFLTICCWGFLKPRSMGRVPTRHRVLSLQCGYGYQCLFRFHPDNLWWLLLKKGLKAVIQIESTVKRHPPKDQGALLQKRTYIFCWQYSLLVTLLKS